MTLNRKHFNQEAVYYLSQKAKLGIIFIFITGFLIYSPVNYSCHLRARAVIVIYDPEKIQDTANYENPVSYPEGIEYVFVGGKPVVKDGNFF